MRDEHLRIDWDEPALGIVGALSLTYGVVGTILAATAKGHHDLSQAVSYTTVYTGATAILTIRPSLRRMPAAAVRHDQIEVQTSRQATLTGLCGAVALTALIVPTVVLVPGAMFLLGLLGLSTGVLWLVAAATVRYQERYRLHGRVLAGKRLARFQPGSTSFYLLSAR